MDEGPILKQEKIVVENWPPRKSELYKTLSDEGSRLLVEVLPKWINGEIKSVAQDSSTATYCRIINKQDGQLNLGDDGYQNFLKFSAYEGWPGTYFFYKNGDKDIRVKITGAEFVDNKFVIKKVVPEGKKEMGWEEFLRGYKIEGRK
jgi:methionyl-tRNA formyltransferase